MALEVLDILEKNKRMGRMLRKYVANLFFCICIVSMLYSCASLRKSSNSSKNSSMQLSHDPLSFEERRKFDYFFLEAVRQKEIGEIDAAFELFNHCIWDNRKKVSDFFVRL